MARPRLARTCLQVVSLVAVLAGLTPVFASAEVILPPRPIDRKFPEGTFCPLPIDLAFTATGAIATIHFKAEVYVDSSGTPVRAFQTIDNVYVVSEETYQAFYQPWSNPPFCYVGDLLDSTLFINQIPNDSLRLGETFDTDPTARGWDMTHGAYFQSNYTAPKDPEGSTVPSGSLGLGFDSPTPSLSDSATTEITVLGLTGGRSYRLAAWWTVDNMDNEEDPTLTIRISAPDATPLARRTWGRLKATYREPSPKP